MFAFVSRNPTLGGNPGLLIKVRNDDGSEVESDLLLDSLWLGTEDEDARIVMHLASMGYAVVGPLQHHGENVWIPVKARDSV